MDKAEKNAALETLKTVFGGNGVVVVARYSGMTVAEMTDLRGRLKGEGASLKVIKNRLARIALDGRGGQGAADMFVGPVAIAYSADPVSASKVVSDYSKANEKLVLVGALLGEVVINPDGVKALATLPSLDQLRAQILGLIQAPATRVAGVLQAPAAQLARVFDAYARKDAA